ncbi:MAG: NCS2 family permease [Oscillospiraceae bacterium]|nr:NCS2 family permease [Oscillospiraceae bacterium]
MLKTKIEKYFKLKENNTNIQTELIAGLTTFMTMSYIIIVNPNILSVAGMDWGAVFTATILASVISTLVMSLYAKYPFALAPGMGVNAFFAFTVGLTFGWQIALIAVFAEGVIFLIFSLFKVREAIFDVIPKNLKLAIGTGIGLFIAFIGLVNGGVVVANIPDMPVALGDLSNIGVVLTLAGIVITMSLICLKVKGSLLLGILLTWLLGIICQLTGLYVVNPEIGMYSLIPAGFFSPPPSIAGYNIFSAFEYVKDGFGIGIFDFIIILFSFLFVDIFETIGTVIGVSEKAGFTDEKGKLPRIGRILFSDAVGTVVGAGLGTSTTTTYAESAAGILAGGKTGLTSFTVAVLFGLSLFLSPVFSAVPAFATAPALILVGFMMVQNIVKINFNEPTEGIPAFITILIMPLTYNIAEGIIFGFLSYVILKTVTGKRKEISVTMAIISIFLIIKLIVQATTGY